MDNIVQRGFFNTRRRGMSAKFDALITKGITERETGNLERSVEVFSQAADCVGTREDLSTVWAHLGISFKHLSEWGSAENAFNKALEFAFASENTSRQLEARRHLVGVYLAKGEYRKGLEQAVEARFLAGVANRGDLPWFTHGVFTALFVSNAPRGEQSKSCWQETKDLIAVWHRPRTDLISRRVWTVELLRDWALALQPFGIGLAFLALLLAKVWKLKLQECQILQKQ